MQYFLSLGRVKNWLLNLSCLVSKEWTKKGKVGAGRQKTEKRREGDSREKRMRKGIYFAPARAGNKKKGKRLGAKEFHSFVEQAGRQDSRQASCSGQYERTNKKKVLTQLAQLLFRTTSTKVVVVGCKPKAPRATNGWAQLHECQAAIEAFQAFKQIQVLVFCATKISHIC